MYILFCLCLYHAFLGSSGVCAVGYFKCTNDLCIPNKLLCNGVDNCYDGPTRNDEDPQGECQGEIEEKKAKFEDKKLMNSNFQGQLDMRSY